MANGNEEALGKIGEFLGSILIDIMGVLSYVVPGIGEASDIATAPITVAWIFEMVSDVEEPDSSAAELLSAFGGIEELAPFIDIIPSATIAWAYKWYVMKN